MGGQATQNRNRQPRIAVMDSATIDARRRLVLVRRDNIEHLILIGGPTDVVVEQNILRNAPADTAAPRTGLAGPSGIAPLRAPMAPGPDIPVRVRTTSPPSTSRPRLPPCRPDPPATDARSCPRQAPAGLRPRTGRSRLPSKAGLTPSQRPARRARRCRPPFQNQH